ncbi:TUP1-like enhancer of split [Dictyocaulus viviparus]|uniref:TUP1-like enhancer of split n=1 Tax=Dictyocaulus viviparus TaxID=29172 RepID=A0A0D8XK17_DICVI|nr:TUP1-like enhancer of split [Dictyocaulus viviparus]
MVRTIDGKRRIQPIFLGSTMDDEQALVTHVNSHASAGSSQTDDLMTSDTDEVVTRDKCSPLAKLHNRLASTDDSMVESTDDEIDSSDVDGGGKPEKEAVQLEDMGKKEKLMMTDFKKPVLRPLESSRIEVTHASTVLDVPEQRSTISETVQGVVGDSVEVDNDWIMSGVRASRISYLNARATAWSVEIGPTVVCRRSGPLLDAMTGVSLYTQVQMVGCAFAINSTLLRFAWESTTFHRDIDKIKSIVSRQSITDCVVKDANLTSISITPTGIPLLGFSTGNIFTFSLDMNCWQIVDSLTPLMKLCDSVEADELSDGPIGRLLKRRKRPGLLPSIPRWVSASVKESLLEGWLQAAKTVGSSVDYRCIMMTYVQQLVRNRSLSKISNVLLDLNGQGSVCGVKRNALREDVERIIIADPMTASLVRLKVSAGSVF